MDKTRETWVDIAKGIGIILVIIGHANCPNLPHGIIYSFPDFVNASPKSMKSDC